MIDPERVKQDFPLLAEREGKEPLVYLDSAATSHKPWAVIRAVEQYYRSDNANVHRGVYALAARSTEAYEEARAKVARFLGAREDEVVFTRGTTESLNLVAAGYGRTHLGPGDEILLTALEHHANLIPWQRVAAATGARLRFVPLREDGSLSLAEVSAHLGPRTKLVALAHVSNVLGTILPVREVAALAHRHGAVVVVDGAQSVPHMPVNVRDLDCDFLAFSGHKMCGPMGIGVLYGRRELLRETEPLLFGGEMIEEVTLETATFKVPPWKFEGGTPNVAGAVGLGVAVDYLSSLGMGEIHEHERRLTQYALQRLEEVEGLTVYGPRERAGIITFNVAGIHPHDVATALDQEGVAIRAGHHCAQPLMRWLGATATARASFYLYNTFADVDALVRALVQAKEFFGHVLR